MPGEPHPDAVKIGLAVRALPTSISIATVESARALLPEWPLLTFLGERATMAVNINMAGIVSSRAVQGQRPRWYIGTPRLRPMRHDDNRVVLVGSRGGRNGYSIGSHHPLELVDPTIAQMMCARAEYAIWHNALCRLALTLRGSLSGHETQTPAAAAAPWIEREVSPRVLASSQRVTSTPLPLNPTRPLAAKGRTMEARPLILAGARGAAAM
jgi:hypothetical protein